MTSTNILDNQYRRNWIKSAGQGALAAAAFSINPSLWAQTALTPVMAIYPSRGAPTWPLWIAQHTGLFKKYGLEADLRFGVHPLGLAAMVGGEAQFTVYNVEQVLSAVARAPALVMVGSYLNRGAFGMIARKDIRTLKDLRGKRIGVGRLGDPPYVYSVELLNKAGIASTDVQWVSTGADSNTRSAMLVNGQLDAALLVSPSYFRLVDQGNFNQLANLLDSDINISTSLVFSRRAMTANPALPEMVLRATTEAVKIFYEDKTTAMAAFRAFDAQATDSDMQRIWEMYAKAKAFERIPLMSRTAIKVNTARVVDEVPAVRNLDLSQVVDNSAVRKLIAEGWFQKLYGPGIKAEIDKALKDAV
jgi:ABC-type nitrate/sulfonate/bicarbonate transport system substrate-binding protein